MNLSNFAKQLKKRLRRIRRPTWTWTVLLLLMVILLLAKGIVAASRPTYSGTGLLPGFNAAKMTETQAEFAKMLQNDGKPKQVVLNRQYLCGAETEPLGTMSVSDVIHRLMTHPEWTGQLEGTDTVVFTEQVNDLSEACKDNAYISLDKNGHLSLFDGPPKKDKVIRTFFQIDIEYLESSLPHETVEKLYEGIRIHDLSEYNSVLSTFSDYAVDETEKVMKATE